MNNKYFKTGKSYDVPNIKVHQVIKMLSKHCISKLGYLLVSFFIPLLIISLYLIFTMFLNYKYPNLTDVKINILSQVFWCFLCIIIYLTKYKKYFNDDFFSNRLTRFDVDLKTIFKKIVLIFFFVWAFTVLASTWYYAVLNPISNSVGERARLIGQDKVYFILLSVFIAPISEELLYRAIIFNHLRFKKQLPVFTSAFISSIFFAIMHFEVMHIFTSFIFGFFMCILYSYRENIIYSIIAHIVFNAFTIMVGYVGVNIPIFFANPIILLPLFVLLCYIIIQLYLDLNIFIRCDAVYFGYNF